MNLLLRRRMLMALNSADKYIKFVDPVVAQICATNWGDGVGITKKQAAAVTSLHTAFEDRTDVSSFDEGVYFTSVKDYGGAFRRSSLVRIKLPKGMRLENDGNRYGQIFYEAGSLQEIDFGDLERESNTLTRQYQLFVNCSSLTTLHYSNVEQIHNLMPTTIYYADTPFYYNNDVHYVYVGSEELRDLVIPDTISVIRPRTFFRFNRLLSLTIPSSVTQIGNGAFAACTGLKNVICNTNMPLGEITDSGDTEGSVLHIFGNATGTNGNGNFGFTTIIIEGDFTQATGTGHQFGKSRGTYDFILRVKGNFNANKSNQEIYNQDLVFFECGGQITSLDNAGTLYSKIKEGCIFHLGYNGVAGLAAYIVRDASNFDKMSKIYVGDGSSAAHDNAILQQYLADTDWAQYSAKLDTWYNYINSLDANPDYIN